MSPPLAGVQLCTYMRFFVHTCSFVNLRTATCLHVHALHSHAYSCQIAQSPSHCFDRHRRRRSSARRRSSRWFHGATKADRFHGAGRSVHGHQAWKK